jgi:hypothetical protein
MPSRCTVQKRPTPASAPKQERLESGQPLSPEEYAHADIVGGTFAVEHPSLGKAVTRWCDGRYGAKRLQPGELHGRYHEKNYSVPASELARDGRVIDTGVQFAGRPQPGEHAWAAWWQRADSGERPQDAQPKTGPRPTDAASKPSPAAASRPASASHPAHAVATGGAVSIELPLRITISLGAATTAELVTPKPESAPEDLEALREPWHDTDYSTRNGFDEISLEYSCRCQ